MSKLELTAEEQQAFQWAMKQDFQSVAARYAKTLAKALSRAGADYKHSDTCAAVIDARDNVDHIRNCDCGAQ